MTRYRKGVSFTTKKLYKKSRTHEQKLAKAEKHRKHGKISKLHRKKGRVYVKPHTRKMPDKP